MKGDPILSMHSLRSCACDELPHRLSERALYAIVAQHCMTARIKVQKGLCYAVLVRVKARMDLDHYHIPKDMPSTRKKLHLLWQQLVTHSFCQIWSPSIVNGAILGYDKQTGDVAPDRYLHITALLYHLAAAIKEALSYDHLQSSWHILSL